MDGYKQEISLIKKVLKENPKGMTVTDIARKININRNSVAKYLDIMRISGHVEMITFGPAKVFFPSRRVPISDLLNQTSDYILVFDADLKITMINDSFLDFLNLDREEIISQYIHNAFSDIFNELSEILIGIKQALDGKRYQQDTKIQIKDKYYFFMIKIVPTTFEDGRTGGTMILKDNTYHKLAEKLLRESEENFRNILKKMGKE